MLSAGAGCASYEKPGPADLQLRELATIYLQRGIQFPDNPAVRAQAVEACEMVMGAEAKLMIRQTLQDEHPGVRFAALMSIGRLQDADALAQVRKYTSDADPSVRVAACFAAERLGDNSYRVLWADLLRKNPEPAVRRNAALALGLLGDRRAISLLAAAANQDKDDGVRLQALEGMARLGDPEAVTRFLQDSFGSAGYRQPFALLTLAHVDDERVGPALRTRLASAPYLEARLAAARSLGARGYADGYNLALRCLQWNQPQVGLPDDPPETQVMRVRTMAAMALGEIGDRRALDALKRRMETPDDPRVQLAASTAILMIMDPKS